MADDQKNTASGEMVKIVAVLFYIVVSKKYLLIF